MLYKVKKLSAKMADVEGLSIVLTRVSTILELKFISSSSCDNFGKCDVKVDAP